MARASQLGMASPHPSGLAVLALHETQDKNCLGFFCTNNKCSEGGPGWSSQTEPLVFI